MIENYSELILLVLQELTILYTSNRSRSIFPYESYVRNIRYLQYIYLFLKKVIYEKHLGYFYYKGLCQKFQFSVALQLYLPIKILKGEGDSDCF